MIAKGCSFQVYQCCLSMFDQSLNSLRWIRCMRRYCNSIFVDLLLKSPFTSREPSLVWVSQTDLKNFKWLTDHSAGPKETTTRFALPNLTLFVTELYNVGCSSIIWSFWPSRSIHNTALLCQQHYKPLHHITKWYPYLYSPTIKLPDSPCWTSDTSILSMICCGEHFLSSSEKQ